MISLKVDGYFDVSFYDIKNGYEVSEEDYKNILDKLNCGDFAFSMDSKKICRVEDDKELYTVGLNPGDYLEYEWDEV